MVVFAVAAVGACASAPKPAPAPAGADPSRPAVTMQVRTVVSDAFSPQTGPAAVKAFVPDVAATESGGECAMHKLTPISSAQVATAYFPTRAEPKMTVALTFDSAGHLTRYSEVRGFTGIRNIPPGTNEAQRAAMLKDGIAATRTTSISFDYAVDQAVVRNHGGGQPDHAVLATPREIESLAVFGPVTQRLVRVRKLCGV
jgi:hypothetical protein